ncbi:MAG: hypothetical protein EOO29_45395 [Comamonadaceae bacterium]|nr:MAG: hypothetical protein EOO29_45395 [Comamonadaceae bacterium]
MKLLTASLCTLCVITLLAGCNAATTRPSSAMASGRDRTFSVPVYGTDTAPAYAAATRECQKLALFPKLLRDDSSRLVFECVSESPHGRP